MKIFFWILRILFWIFVIFMGFGLVMTVFMMNYFKGKKSFVMEDIEENTNYENFQLPQHQKSQDLSELEPMKRLFLRLGYSDSEIAELSE